MGNTKENHNMEDKNRPYSCQITSKGVVVSNRMICVVVAIWLAALNIRSSYHKGYTLKSRFLSVETSVDNSVDNSVERLLDEGLQFPDIPIENKETKVIFYHVYLPSDAAENALRIVEEQLGQMGGKDVTLLYNTIGDPDMLSEDQMNEWCKQYEFTACHHLQHVASSQEELTLKSVHDFCHVHPSRRVGYVHNKGSHHASPINEVWRYLMTETLVKDECWDTNVTNTAGDTCNACGLFLTTDWGLYFAGNVWTADCSYVKDLVPPTEHEAKARASVGDAFLRRSVKQFQMEMKDVPPVWNLGIGRYANEWWIASHPSLHPCDFSASVPDNNDCERTKQFIMWMQKTVEDRDYRANAASLVSTFTPDAPYRPYRLPRRFRDGTETINLKNEYFALPGKIHRWLELYAQLPDQNSWVWKYFPEGEDWKNRVNEYGLTVLEQVLPIKPKTAVDLNHLLTDSA